MLVSRLKQTLVSRASSLEIGAKSHLSWDLYFPAPKGVTPATLGGGDTSKGANICDTRALRVRLSFFFSPQRVSFAFLEPPVCL